MKKCIIICPRLIEKEPKLTQYRVQEIRSLIKTLSQDMQIYDVLPLNIRRPNSKLFIGSGNAQHIKQIIIDNNIDTVVLDTVQIHPVQQRNLTKLWQVNVIERTRVILDIFQQHAFTYEGKLQVEMASLTYQRSRLVRSWEHLERQRGGINYIAGPGESQLELDKRMLNKKICTLQAKLKHVHEDSQLLMRKRCKNNLPIIALAGYTSAGKSTLFNRLTHSKNVINPQPFTTLNITSHLWSLNHGIPCILVDTIGFITDLPHELIDAFRATLVGLHEADFILHVQDLSNSDLQNQRDVVISTLNNMHISNPQVINVFNKIDLIDSKPTEKRTQNVHISAHTGDNCQKLVDLVTDLIIHKFYHLLKIDVNSQSADSIMWLYKYGYVINDTTESSPLSFYIPNYLMTEYRNNFANDSKPISP